jgi:hypothetical protein
MWGEIIEKLEEFEQIGDFVAFAVAWTLPEWIGCVYGLRAW